MSGVLDEALCRDSAGTPRDCAVLLIHSYHPALKWTQSLSAGVADALRPLPALRIDTEYLDAKRRPELEHAESFVELLRVKYFARPPDVILISDDPAFDLLWPKRQALFPNVPIVFMGLNGRRRDLAPGTPGLTGIFERHETDRTVALALALTQAGGMVVITDTSETGLANEPTLERLVAKYPDRKVRIERDLPASRLGRLNDVPADWPIIPMLPLREQESDGPMLSQLQSVALLREALPNPLFYDVEWLMGSGVVGGYNLSGTDHGRQAGELVAEVLRGRSAASLAFRDTTAHRWTFDARELARFGWTPADLPATAELLFTTPSYWDQHRTVLLPASAVLLAAALLILALSATVARQRRSEHRLAAALGAHNAGVFELKGSQSYASPRWLELFDASDAAPLSSEHWEAPASAMSRQAFAEALKRLTAGAARERVEIEIVGSPPRTVDILMTRSSTGTVVGVGTDITARRQLEEEVSRQHRLQALGELSGGIAHDFNNLLTIVNCNAQLIADLSDDATTRRIASDISEAGARAADLTSQLLAFGRPEPLIAGVIDVNQSIGHAHRLLQRLIGPNHELVTLLHDEPLPVALSSAHIEQVLTNLVLNARDAMADGGSIAIETAQTLDDGRKIAVLTVQDTGVGIDRATGQRLFEPFFTTKKVGEGSGLGLSTVYGIVTASGGTVDYDSTPGVGTTFTIRWPLSDAEGAAPRPPPAHPATTLPREERAILLVEDEPGVGRTTENLLTMAGYKITVAKDGREGLKLFQQDPTAFDLVLSDVVLPHMDGVSMMAQISALRPDIRFGFVSGYDRHASLASRLPLSVEMLNKPFSRRELYAFVDQRLQATHSLAADLSETRPDPKPLTS
ncbi:MAG: ATP-binding protein [Pseudomonadota bacterium]